MNDKPKQPESNADLLNGAHQQLERMFRKHFWGAAVLTMLGIVFFVASYGVVVFKFREPANTALVKDIQDSNKQLFEITKVVLNNVSGTNTQAATDALKAVVAQAELHQKAASDLQAKEKETPKDVSTFIQLLGGSVILTIISFLRLQRLQSIDVEMQ